MAYYDEMAGEVVKSKRQSLSQVNPHLICGLCQGYLINATAITECLHTFCRPCIVQFLKEKKTCPLCGVLVHKTKPHVNLRPDKVLQDLVYKLVPGLYKREMMRRKEYHTSKRRAGHPRVTLPQIVDPDGGGASLIYTEDDQISLCLHNCERLPPFVRWGTNSRRQRPTLQDIAGDKRYLLCPAGMTVAHLKKFLTLKFNLEPKYEIELFHTDESLADGYTLIDVAYICDWRMVAPLELFYIVYDVTEKATSLPELVQEKPIVARKPQQGSHQSKINPVPLAPRVKRKRRKPRQALMTRRKSKSRPVTQKQLPAMDEAMATTKVEDVGRDSGIPESPEQGVGLTDGTSQDQSEQVSSPGISSGIVADKAPILERTNARSVETPLKSTATEATAATEETAEEAMVDKSDAASTEKNSCEDRRENNGPSSLDMDTFLDSKQTVLTVETELPVKDTGRNHSGDSGFISQGGGDDSSNSTSDSSSSEPSESERSSSSEASSDLDESSTSAQDDSPEKKKPIEKLVIVCESGKFRHADKNERRRSTGGKSEGGSSGPMRPPPVVQRPAQKQVVKPRKMQSSPKCIPDSVSKGLLLATKLPLDANTKPSKPEAEGSPRKRLYKETVARPVARLGVKQVEPKTPGSPKGGRPAKTQHIKSSVKKFKEDKAPHTVESTAVANCISDNMSKSQRVPILEQFTKDLSSFQKAGVDTVKSTGIEAKPSSQKPVPGQATVSTDCNKVGQQSEQTDVARTDSSAGHAKQNSDSVMTVGKQADCVDGRSVKEAGQQHVTKIACRDGPVAAAGDHSQRDSTSLKDSVLSSGNRQRASIANDDAVKSASASDTAAACESQLSSCPSPSKTSTTSITTAETSPEKRQSVPPAFSSPDTPTIGRPLCTSTPASSATLARKRDQLSEKISSQLASSPTPLRNGEKMNDETHGRALPEDYSYKQKATKSPSTKESNHQKPQEQAGSPAFDSTPSAAKVPAILKQNTNTQLLKPRDGSKSRPRPRPRSTSSQSRALSPVVAPGPPPSPIPSYVEPPTKRARVLPSGYPSGTPYPQGYLYPAANYFSGAHHMGLPATIYGTGTHVQVSHPAMSPVHGPMSPGAHHGYYFNTHGAYAPYFGGAPPAAAHSLPNGYDAPLELTTTRKDPPREAHQREVGKAKEPERTLLRVPSVVRP